MTYDEIKQQVETNRDVKTFSMGELRDAEGAGKLGVHVRATISRKLAGMGLGHVPQALPNSQTGQVRIYKRGTPVGVLIERVLQPGEQNDDAIAELVSGDAPDYAAIVETIRELVAE